MQQPLRTWYAPRLASATALAATLMAIVVGLVLCIDADLLRPLDEPIIATVRAEPLVAPFAWLATATQLGSTWWVALIAVGIGLVELAAGRPLVGLGAAATIGVGAIANSSLKLVVARPRPDELVPIVVEPGYSFPSGHSLSAMVAYGVLAVLVARTSWPNPIRGVVLAALAAVAVVVGLSRIYLGVHYPSDVLGGWLLGIAWVALFAGLSVGFDPRVSAAPARGAGAAAADPAGPRSGPPAPG